MVTCECGGGVDEVSVDVVFVGVQGWGVLVGGVLVFGQGSVWVVIGCYSWVSVDSFGAGGILGGDFGIVVVVGAIVSRSDTLDKAAAIVGLEFCSKVLKTFIMEDNLWFIDSWACWSVSTCVLILVNS